MPWILQTAPQALRLHLLAGSEGAGHLAQAAALAAHFAREAAQPSSHAPERGEAGKENLFELARSLRLAAWIESPLDGDLAAQAAADPDTPPVAAALAGHVAASSRQPGDLGYYRRLAERRDQARIRAYLDREQGKDPDNLFWAKLSLTHALAEEDWDLAGAAIAVLPEPLARLIHGDIALLAGRPEHALANYHRCLRLWDGPGPSASSGQASPWHGQNRGTGSGRAAPCDGQSAGGWPPGLHPRMAQALLAMGDTAGAAAELRRGLGREPWRVGALLALHDLEAGWRERVEDLPGSVAVLLYTYEKASDLDRTLASLAASALDAARIFVLDNGGTDATPQVLAAWEDRLGADRLRVIRLPVNVGAPAARNWLMRLPEVRAMDWAVYVDDDVLLPKDWLGRLGAAAALYPQAGVWGCRVRDCARPSRIQSADTFLVPLEASAERHARRFELSNCHHQTLDRGQFAYLRPCATVTGCCHLFRTATLAAQGGFDLRYSPSQYDDLDHDIRLLLAGKTPVYQGHLAVDHFKSTGSQGVPGQSQYAVGFANQYKLHHSYSPEQFADAARAANQAAWEDALEKWGRVWRKKGARP